MQPITGDSGGGGGSYASDNKRCRRVRSRLASASSMVMAASVAQAWLTPVAWEEVALRAAHVRVRERVEMRVGLPKRDPNPSPTSRIFEHVMAYRRPCQTRERRRPAGSRRRGSSRGSKTRSTRACPPAAPACRPSAAATSPAAATSLVAAATRPATIVAATGSSSDLAWPRRCRPLAGSPRAPLRCRGRCYSGRAVEHALHLVRTSANFCTIITAQQSTNLRIQLQSFR